MSRPKSTEFKDGFIYSSGVKKAKFEGRTLTEFYNDGEDEKSELLQALKNSKEHSWEAEELSDTQIRKALDIWELVPEAPRPQPTLGLGEKHPKIYDFIAAKYPRVLKIRYPQGRWDKDAAGLGVNKTPYRDDKGQVSPKSMQKLKGKREEHRRNAEAYIASNEY
jgi:hypothetical protein